MPATRATTAAGRQRATSSRDRATCTLAPSPARVPRDLDLHCLVPQRRLEPAHPGAQLLARGALRLPGQALRADREEPMETAGIEPATQPCKGRVFPLAPRPRGPFEL